MPARADGTPQNRLRVLRGKLRVLGLRGSARRLWWIVSREGVHGVAARLRSWGLVARPGSAAVVASPAAVASPAVRATAAGEGINLVGHPFGALGMGEHVRKSAHAFAAAEVPFALVNTFDQAGPHAGKFGEFPFAHLLRRDSRYAVSLFHLNADEMPLASAHLGADFFANRYNIGYWAWELAIFPDAWLPSFDWFDEIWAPSRFIQQAVAAKSPVPVVYMPLAVGFPPSAPLPRRHFGLPEDRFLFLFYFDFTSYMARKNPLATLAAFDLAFPRGARPGVGLVIKLNGMEQRGDDYRRFLDALGERDDAIFLIDRVLTDHEVRSLVQCCDSFVSLHRSEGFGRGLAEAMYYGNPAIGTGYSGNLDFMHEDNACVVDHVLVPVAESEYPHAAGQLWADPDVEQAAGHMRRLVADPAYAAALGARGAAFIHSHNGFAAVGARYRARLARLGFVAS